MSERYHPFVLCCGPGTLRGVHVAGVLEGLMQEHFRESDEGKRVLTSLRGIRASSAGVPSSLFFAVAQNLEEGTRGVDIYTEDLTDTRFLNVHRILRIYARSARKILFPRWNRPPPPPVINIDYLMQRIREKLPRDFRTRLRNLPFDYDVDVFNRRTKEVETVSMKEAEDPLKLVRESITAIPGYIPTEDQEYVDAAVARGLFDHRELRQRYPPPHRIVYVANERIASRSAIDRVREWLTHQLYGLASKYDGIGRSVFSQCLQGVRGQVEAIRADLHAFLVFPRYRPPLRETVRKPVLERLRGEGKQQLQRILQFIRAA